MVLSCAVGLVLGIVLGGVHFLLVPPQYTAIALVSTVGKGTDDLGQLRWSQALARVAMTPQLTTPALQAADVPEMVERPKDSIQTAAAPDAPLFSVRARSRSAEQAQAAANAIAFQSQAWSQQTGLPADVQVTPAPLPTRAAPGAPVRMFFGAMLGALIGLTGFLVRRDQLLVRSSTH